MTALAVIGAVGDALGLLTWGIDKFPAQPPQNSLLRVALALNSNGITNAGGLSPDVWAYDALGNEIGRTTYIKVEGEASGDVICLAYMTLTWADGGEHGWNGDLGRLCGQKWFPSNVVIGESYKPACTWIGYESADVASGVVLDMVAVGPVAGDEVKGQDFYCAPAVQNYYHYSANRPRRRESLSSLPQDKFDSQIVISESDQHNGTSKELCNSPTSYGPSFVSTAEHAFCDMKTKTLWPLCNDSPSGTGTCFDLDTQTLIGVEGVHRRSTEFTTVEYWD